MLLVILHLDAGVDRQFLQTHISLELGSITKFHHTLRMVDSHTSKLLRSRWGTHWNLVFRRRYFGKLVQDTIVYLLC